MKRMRYANPALNLLSEEEIKEYRELKLRNQLKYCYRNSEFYHKKFREIGFHPEDIKTIEDFQKLPVLMDKTSERESQRESMERLGHPFGMHLCCSPDKVLVTATTSGTTGVPTFTYTVSRDDIGFLENTGAYMLQYAGISPGDRVLFCHALGIYATTLILWAIRGAGALPIDVDVRAGTAAILSYAKLTRPSAAMMTPSLAEYLIDKAPEVAGLHVRDFNFKALLTVGEIGIGIPEIKQKIEDAYGCRVYDWIGPIGGTFAFSCDSDQYHGMHCVTPDFDLYPDDLVDPETKEPLAIMDGVIGEAIYTSLDRQACPMVRFSSGDIVQVFTGQCPACGFKGRRLKVVGRSDDMLIVKGTNIYPAAIKKAISGFIPEITGELRIVLDQPPPRVVPPLKIKLEYGPGTDQGGLSGLEARIKKALHEEVRLTPEIIWCSPGTLQKSMAKTPVFEKQY